MITKLPPNTIVLSGGEVLVDDLATGVAATPGMLAEMYSDGGTAKWRPNSSATNQPTLAVYDNQPELGKGVDYVYAVGDRAHVRFLEKGDTAWMLLPSGQNIALGDKLQSNGDGYLKEATADTAAANVARFQAMEALGAITVLTRCRVQVI